MNPNKKARKSVINTAQLRHPGENIFIAIAIAVILAAIGILVLINLNLDAFYNFSEEILIETYISGNPKDATLSKDEILEKLPDSYNTFLLFVKLSYIIVPILLPIVILILAVKDILARWKKFGEIHANSIITSEADFPEIHRILHQYCLDLSIKKVPKLYFYFGDKATETASFNVPGFHDVIILDARFIDIASSTSRRKIFSFILARELASFKLERLIDLVMVLFNFTIIKFAVFSPFQRARTYSCDTIASKVSGDLKGDSLIAQRIVNTKRMKVEKAKSLHTLNASFLSSISNFFDDIPPLSWRQEALIHNKTGRLFSGL